MTAATGQAVAFISECRSGRSRHISKVRAGNLSRCA
jgi:hypothetical protein